MTSKQLKAKYSAITHWTKNAGASIYRHGFELKASNEADWVKLRKADELMDQAQKLIDEVFAERIGQATVREIRIEL